MTRGGSAVVALLAGVLCLILTFSPRLNPLLGTAEGMQRDIAVATAATYVSLRAINAALSVAQEVEVGGSVVVTGNAQPLKWLEPVDDTVERISAVIFAVAVLTSVLSLSLAPVSAVGFGLLALALLGRCGCEAGRGGWAGAPPGLRRVLAGCGGLGFAFALGLPLAFAAGVWGGELLTATAWNEASATLDRISAEARALIGVDDVDRSWREAMEDYLGAARTFWDSADALLQAAITLTGIFLLRMVVLPSILLLALLSLSRRAIGRG